VFRKHGCKVSGEGHIRKHEYAMSGLLVLSCQLRKLIEKLAALRRRFTTFGRPRRLGGKQRRDIAAAKR
jgi:hypothetical protein